MAYWKMNDMCASIRLFLNPQHSRPSVFLFLYFFDGINTNLIFCFPRWVYFLQRGALAFLSLWYHIFSIPQELLFHFDLCIWFIFCFLFPFAASVFFSRIKVLLLVLSNTNDTKRICFRLCFDDNWDVAISLKCHGHKFRANLIIFLSFLWRWII